MPVHFNHRDDGVSRGGCSLRQFARRARIAPDLLA
jgi:hypothetical protein